jgi:hypothetical protein
MNEGVVRVADAMQSQWLVGLYLLMLGLLAWCNMQSGHKLRLYLSSSLRLRPLVQSARNQITVNDRSFQVMLLFSLMAVSVFIFQSGVRSGSFYPEFTLFLKIFGLTAVLLISSTLVVLTLGWVFEGVGLGRIYVYQCLLQLVLLGMLLFPLDLLLTYSPMDRQMMSLVGGALIALVLLFRWLWGLAYGLGSSIRPLYIVLYLCAAEILPAAIGLKMIGFQTLFS